MSRGKHRPHKHQRGMGVICGVCWMMTLEYIPRERTVAELAKK